MVVSSCDLCGKVNSLLTSRSWWLPRAEAQVLCARGTSAPARFSTKDPSSFFTTEVRFTIFLFNIEGLEVSAGKLTLTMHQLWCVKLRSSDATNINFLSPGTRVYLLYKECIVYRESPYESYALVLHYWYTVEMCGWCKIMQLWRSTKIRFTYQFQCVSKKVMPRRMLKKNSRYFEWTVILIAFRICMTCYMQKLTVWPGKPPKKHWK